MAGAFPSVYPEAATRRYREFWSGTTVDTKDPSSNSIAAADAELRLPLAKMTYWDIFPFDEDGLTVARLRPPVVPEKARNGDIDSVTIRGEDYSGYLAGSGHSFRTHGRNERHEFRGAFE